MNPTEYERINDLFAARDRNAANHRYSFFDSGNLFNIQERERRILASLSRRGFRNLANCKILEIGCGAGFWLRSFIQWGAQPTNVVGVDINAERVAKAREGCPPGVDIRCAPASELPFASANFDLVFQSTVFSTILNESLRMEVASEMLRVVKSTGIILWYDMFLNNPWNPNVRGIGMKQIRKLFPLCEITSERLTLAPPLVRVLARRCRVLCALLAMSRMASAFYLVVIQPKSSCNRG